MKDNNIKRQNVYRIIMLFILTIVITSMVTTIVMYNKFGGSKNTKYITVRETSETTDENLPKILSDFKRVLKEKYIGDMDESKMLDGAIKGYIEALGDPYTEYLDKEEMAKFKEETNAEYVGIGVYLSANKEDNTILVVGVMKGAPALDAGMQAGDIITKVEGEQYTGEQIDNAIKILKGVENTDVKVTVLRDGKELELNITRKKITVEHVASQMLQNNIAYIQVDSFDSGVAEAFKSQITDLKDKGATGIILDLRSNGGGIVDEATGIADVFLNKDETILITKAKNKDEKHTKATHDATIKDIPIVVLVNQGTASASEILTGALKDKYPNTTVVGKTTYGKGVIQTLYELSDGTGLKITTEEYYTPNHNKINKEGIKPDIEVELTKNEEGVFETGFEKDAQILKAIETLNK